MEKPSKIKTLSHPPTLGDADFTASVMKDKAQYRRQLKKMQQRLRMIQQAYYHQRRRAIIVLEGWDAAGKGGAIRRLTERLDPRGCRVIPVSAPTAEERANHYLYRFFKNLPPTGNITIFDRSWYGRVLVERVEGLASEAEWQRAYTEINEFERLLADDGVKIIKLFLHITPEEQRKRFIERLHNPHKRWKITEDDFRNRLKWPAYETAIDDMFRHTTTNTSAWQLIAADRKWFTRVDVLKRVCEGLEKGVDITPPPLDDAVIAAAEKALGEQLDAKLFFREDKP